MVTAGKMSQSGSIPVAGKPVSSADKKHTLESDEEDGVDDYNKLDEDDIEGMHRIHIYCLYISIYFYTRIHKYCAPIRIYMY